MNIKYYLQVLRIDHWFKNSFLLVGTFLAISLNTTTFSGKIVFLTIFSFLLTSLVASTNYILNEILDAKFDAKHPKKKYRPIPSGLVKIKYLVIIASVLFISSITLSLLFTNIFLTISLILFFISGIIYNVQPIRAKELPYLDVLAESINNPIRLLIGWFTVPNISFLPPMSSILAFWFFGGLLMTGKRYAEYIYLKDKINPETYRKSFKYYNEKTLIITMITYANLLFFFLGVFIVVYNRNYVFGLPFILIFMILYMKLIFENNSIAQEPEKIFRKPKFLMYCITLGLLFVGLNYLPNDLTTHLNFFRLISH